MAEGVYKGRKPVTNSLRLRELQGQGFGVTETAQKLGIRRGAYRVTGSMPA